MGHKKKGHNWKAREKKTTEIDKANEKKVEVDIQGVTEVGYDETNALVLPSKKRKTKTKGQTEESQPKRLSKKQRKRLEKVVENKEKKVKRAEVLEALQRLQASEEELSLLTSTTEIYSGGARKRKFEIEHTESGAIKINAISGSNKKRKKVKEEEESSTDTSEEETDEDEEHKSEDKNESGDESLSENGEEATDIMKEEQTVPKIELAVKVEPKCITEEKKKHGSAMKTSRKTIYIPLTRTPEIQEARLMLPILGEEQSIMEAINDNPVIILCGETGSGKTTQVPQFLYEAGYAHDGGVIGITEPRRVAAVSMSKRVATEMNLTSREVSYQIRYDGNTTVDTKIKFMTDGVLLKEVQNDFLLTKYSVIIVDEAHERSMYTDILIGLLSRIVPLRNKKGRPLKLIIMSATLRVEDFTENPRLFPTITPPVLKVDSRQFPVTIHFNKRTPGDNYLPEAYKKVCKIHRQLPEGGILVFVTGQQEVHSLCAKLRRTFPQHKQTGTTDNSPGNTEKNKISKLPKLNLDDYSVLPVDEEAEMVAAQEQQDITDADWDLCDEDEDADQGERKTLAAHEEPLYVLPLYSLLATDKQQKVFDPPPDGCRLVVVATNVAETSLTIPNIKYVVDTGKVKTKFYDKVTGVSTFHVTWTSKASGNQRAGRAGRTGPGHCYRLYSSAVFNDEFELFSPAEITNRPVEDLMLQMKDMGIDKVVNFPFPTPPSPESLRAAEKLLISLGALEMPGTAPSSSIDKKASEPVSRMTALGKAMACFPVSPRYGKMLALGHQHDLLQYVVAIVSALSVQEVFSDLGKLPNNAEEKEAQNQQKLRWTQIRKTWSGKGHSQLLGDLMVLLKAVGAAEFAGGTPRFCDQYGLRYKAIAEIRKLRSQLTNAVNAVLSEANLILDPQMSPPNDLQAKLLRQIVLAGMADHVAKKMPQPLPGTEDAKKLKHAYQCLTLEDPVFIHPSSALYKQNTEYIVYQHIDETSKLYMKGVVTVEASWLPLFAPQHCIFSKPLEDPPPRYSSDTGEVLCHCTSTFGPHFWPMPAVEMDYPSGLDKYKLFASFLLDGSVCPKLANFVPTLLSKPSTMVKSWAKLQPRTETFLKTLVAEGVDTKETLEKAWKRNPKYLLAAYREWLPQIQHLHLEDIWPPL